MASGRAEIKFSRIPNNARLSGNILGIYWEYLGIIGKRSCNAGSQIKKSNDKIKMTNGKLSTLSVWDKKNIPAITAGIKNAVSY